ncbi:LysR substrate-binding domain-containing protein [Aliamphritea spongicola]|uniref:LysR substrate-binding domain-containing protein n=1 Tax=Aliamphritea spongicola TaxID=707589 RepID=UPI00196BAA2B|nr:LysR substrate-binding domain-containing protein [Aliamphritea spongicola]MBN3560891.1 LysR family transcriptional regulator [Aliamphritea spongicola]
MQSRRLDLPSLTAIRAFEVAARRQSFKDAADELCVTPAAISRQIKQLEAQLATVLFVRGHRQVTLTAAGERLFRATNTAFDEITSAAREIRGQVADSYLNLHATSSFSRLWMVPRLSRLRQLYPNLHLHLISVESTPGEADKFDAAVTLGLHELAGYQAEFLFAEEIFPVCTPEFLKDNPQADSLQGLQQLPLLDLDPAFWQARWWSPVDWHFWLRHCGVENPQVKAQMYFSHFPMLLDTVLEGLGVGLGWRHLTDDLLRSGRLIRPVAESYAAPERKHYFVCRQELANEPGMQLLRDWLLEETAGLRR